MVPDSHGAFRRISKKIGEIPAGARDSIEIFSTSIENPGVLDEYKPANLVDFRTNPHVPEWLKDQGDPDSRWRMLAALRGIEVGYSKEFINWKLWGIDQELSKDLRAGFSESDPCYLSDYGKLGLAAKAEAAQRGLDGEEKFLFCVGFITHRVETTVPSELGLFGEWLSGAKIKPSFVRKTVHEALTT